MKNIVLTRIDDRLIHGQVVTAWIKQYPINKILIIDDELSQNRLMERIYKAAAPMGVEVLIQSVSEAGEGREFSDTCEGSGNHRVASQRGD